MGTIKVIEAISAIAIFGITRNSGGPCSPNHPLILSDEQHLAAGTTLTSCGIAYAMRYIRAASEGGVELGFKADDAKAIVMQTMKGAVELLEASGLHPEAAIDLVTTPGGVTIKGLNEMEHAGFTSAVIRGLKAGAK